MEETKTKICRLCLKLACNDHFEVLDDVKRKMLQTLPLSLRSAISEQPIICRGCSEQLQRSFDFKMSGLTNDDYVKTFCSGDKKRVVLEEVILKSENHVKDADQQRACRLCLKYYESKLLTVVINKEDIFLKDMFNVCFSEIDLNITNDPLLCSPCLQSLQDQSALINSCTRTEEKIEEFSISISRTDTESINLFEVFEFASKVHNDRMCNPKMETAASGLIDEACSVKEEDTFVELECKEFLEKVEENIKSEGDTEENMCFEDYPEMLTNSDGMYVCPVCQHQTNRKDSLEKHLLVHKDAAEIPMVKCPECDFQTKWKGDLKKHMLRHKSTVEIHMYGCEKCKYKSKYKNHLRRHTKTHMEKKEPMVYRCQHCHVQTNNKTYFRQHNKSKHDCEVLDVLKCEYCNYSTKSGTNLNVHVDVVHKTKKKSGDKYGKVTDRYTCEICGYKTDKTSHFKEHELSHKPSQEVEMHNCDVCPFQTKYKNSMKKHRLTHSNAHKKKPKVPMKNQFIKT